MKYIRPIYFALVALLLIIVVVRLLGEDTTMWKAKVSPASGLGLIITYILGIIAMVSVLVLVVRNLINKPKSAIYSLGGIVFLIILVIIGYAIDNKEVTSTYESFGVTTKGQSGFIGGVLIGTYILLVITVLLVIYTSIREFIQKLNG